MFRYGFYLHTLQVLCWEWASTIGGNRAPASERSERRVARGDRTFCDMWRYLRL